MAPALAVGTVSPDGGWRLCLACRFCRSGSACAIDVRPGVADATVSAPTQRSSDLARGAGNGGYA